MTAILPAGVTVLERGWLSSNNVVIVGPESTALVDSGYFSHAEQTLSLVRRILGGRPLDRLLNTHLHSDHCGGNSALQDAYPGVETFIPPGLAPHVRNWDPVALTYEPTGQHCPRFRFAGLALPGTAMELGGLQWQVHGAPGHDPNSVVLLEPESRTLLSADALWENGFGIIFQELEGEAAFEEVAATLDLIESLHPRIVVPGHGRVFADVPEALARARSRLAAYLANPTKHAAHAAKVLLKFKLLEVQRLPWSELEGWASSTPYFRLIRERWFPQAGMQAWLGSLFADLVKSGVARRETDIAVNT